MRPGGGTLALWMSGCVPGSFDDQESRLGVDQRCRTSCMLSTGMLRRNHAFTLGV